MGPRSGKRTGGRRTDRTSVLVIGALGVVFGDIGTSPLYALQAALSTGGIRLARAEVFGLVSLVFWALLLVVTVKYVVLVLRADNDGEGGILALSTLVARDLRPGAAGLAVLAGVVGASLFFGDSVLTPAISVLSAVEGLRVADPALPHLVVPAALLILTVLFGLQRFSTEGIGRVFGPVMTLWFLTLALLGLPRVVAHPGVLLALSPTYGIAFVATQPVTAFLALGAVVLAITGAEALYADLGHFGPRPIRLAWGLVLPSLVLNYLGQAALVLVDPAAAGNPFFHLAPTALRLPLVALATCATVIASQAVIAGTFSVARQAMRLGYLPHLRVRSTSSRYPGQIYLPTVNVLLFVCVAAVVLGFGSSARLADAYGIAVTSTFTLTTVLLSVLMRRTWGWPVAGIVAFLGTIGVIEVCFLAANLMKVGNGGWLPLSIAAVATVSMLTWRTGQRLVSSARHARAGTLNTFVERELPRTRRTPGTAIYPHAAGPTMPLALRLVTELTEVAHERLVIVHVESLPVPYVREPDRISVTHPERAALGLHELTVRYGFHEPPDLPRVLGRHLDAAGRCLFDPGEAIYVLSALTVRPGPSTRLAFWRQRLFLVLTGLADTPAHQFHLPAERTVTLGTEVLL